MRHIREIRNITIAGLVAGLLYSLLTDDLTKPAPILNGIIIGILGGFFSGIFELIIFRPKRSRPAFAFTVILKVFTYFALLSVLILLVKARVDSAFMTISFSEYISSDIFRDFIVEGEFSRILVYAVSMIFVIIFTMQTSRYLGKGVLLNLVTGKYYHPREENKIFLLIDVCGSTGIAEKMNPIDYFKLLDRFFFDVFEGIHPYEGRIYRFVGDQVTIEWNAADHNSNANCIRAFFAVKQRIHDYREYYHNTFGFVPDFRGTAHMGNVVTVEIGDVKTQVVYQGVALHEVNALEKKEGRINNGLCISQELMDNLELPSFCSATTSRSITLENNRVIHTVEIIES